MVAVFNLLSISFVHDGVWSPRITMSMGLQSTSPDRAGIACCVDRIIFIRVEARAITAESRTARSWTGSINFCRYGMIG